MTHRVHQPQKSRDFNAFRAHCTELVETGSFPPASLPLINAQGEKAPLVVWLTLRNPAHVQNTGGFLGNEYISVRKKNEKNFSSPFSASAPAASNGCANAHAHAAQR